MARSGSKALFLRNVPIELIREVKAVAARRGETLTAVIAEALVRSLAVEHEAQDGAVDLQGDMRWYQENHSRLQRRYRGEYVAIIAGAVADHGRDFARLAERVFARFGNRNVYMPRVQAAEPTVRVRSPRRTAP